MNEEEGGGFVVGGQRVGRFTGYSAGDRMIVEVKRGDIDEIVIAPDATRQELKNAITYLVSVIDRLSGGKQWADFQYH